MDRKEQEKRVYLLRNELESPMKKLTNRDNALDTLEKHFNYMSEDRRLLAFSNDVVCMNSDCFILFAIAHMGVATKQSISDFLKAMASKNPSLSIVYEKTRDSLESRLRTLYKHGFLFIYRYTVVTQEGGKETEQIVSLYTVVEAGRDVARQRLQTQVAFNAGMQYKQPTELIGWACASYVGASIVANSPYFVEYLDRVLRTKQIGSFYFPMEMKFCKDKAYYYVAVMASYLGYNDSIHTKESYIEYCAYKINAVKNYLYCRTKKGVSLVVIAVENNADLMEFCDMVYKSEVLNEYLDRILFTGECIANKYTYDSGKKFLRMCLDSQEEIGYRFECVEPTFM